MAERLTEAQERALRMLDEDGSYYQSRDNSSNWYHERHRPGNLYVDARTAKVLIERGLAEMKWGRLYRTPEGTAVARGQKADA